MHQVPVSVQDLSCKSLAWTGIALLIADVVDKIYCTNTLACYTTSAEE